MKTLFKTSLVVAVLVATFSASAQFSPVQGDNGQANPQVIGDTTLNDLRTNSQATQTGNSANSNAAGNTINPTIDTRTQISPNINPNTSSTATGAILGNESQASASNGPQTTNASSQNDNRSGVAGSGNSASSSTGTNTSRNQVSGTQSLTGTQAQNGGNTTGMVTGGATTVGGQSANTRSGVDNSGNVGLAVDASSTDNSKYDGRALFIPAVIPQTPASYVAAANIIKETTACGPLMKIRKTDINGVDIGWFWNTTVAQGERYDIVEDFYYDQQGNESSFRIEKIGGEVRYKGTQAVIFVSMAGTATAKNIGLGGGGGSNMNWGQAGGGNSGSMQQMVTNIQMIPCFLPVAAAPQKPQVEIRYLPAAKKNNE